jgi:hypothetical protein
MEEELEPINLVDYVEAYEELTKMQLWDWLSYNGYIKQVEEIQWIKQ